MHPPQFLHLISSKLLPFLKPRSDRNYYLCFPIIIITTPSFFFTIFLILRTEFPTPYRIPFKISLTLHHPQSPSCTHLNLPLPFSLPKHAQPWESSSLLPRLLIKNPMTSPNPRNFDLSIEKRKRWLDLNSEEVLYIREVDGQILKMREEV